MDHIRICFYRCLLLLLILVLVQSEYTSLQWEDCGSDPSIQIERVAVSPMPVLVPGELHFSLRARMSPPRRLERMILTLQPKRKLRWFSIPLPCIANIGSCEYDDTCTLLATMQRENWAGVMRDMGSQIENMLRSVGISDQCGVDVDIININNYTMRLPPIPSILAFFAEGDYVTKLQAKNYITGQPLLCLNLKMSMHEQTETCTDWFCRFRQAF